MKRTSLMPTTEKGQAAMKTGAGVSVGAILLAIAGYAISDHDTVVQTAQKVEIHDTQFIEQKHTNEALRKDISKIQTSVGVIGAEISHINENVSDIKQLVKEERHR